jgi:hypothetical protein
LVDLKQRGDLEASNEIDMKWERIDEIPGMKSPTEQLEQSAYSCSLTLSSN